MPIVYYEENRGAEDDMKTYYWRGKTHSGKAVRGALQAADRSSALVQLQHQGIESAHTFSLPRLQLQRLPSETQVTLFIRQLSTLLSAGLTLSRALEGSIQGLPQGPLRTLTESMLQELQQGQPFSTILSNRPTLFDPFLVHLIRSGEQSSQLPLLLQRAAEHRERIRTLKRQSWKAVAYPAGVLLFTITITLFLLLQVVPQFESLFQSLGGALPPLTQHLLNLAHLLQSHVSAILSTLLLTPLLLYLAYQTLTPLRRFLDHALLQTPLIGITLQEVMIARIGRTLSILHRAAIPLHTALLSSAEMTSLVPVKQAIQQTHDAIHQGASLSSAMQQHKLFPPIAIQMVHAGEQSGELGQMLERLAIYYENEIEHRIEQFTTLLEPLLITLMGALVGVLAIALYQPIFQMGQHL